mgnify:CR=1 FL=1
MVANAIRTELKRSTDVVVRYGGEEFVVFVTDVKVHDLHKIAENVLKIVRDLSIDNEGAGKGAKVTLSAGLYHGTPKKDDTLWDYIELSDKALYEAKSQGRDRVCIHQP